MKVWFPSYYLESHRDPTHRAHLAALLAERGYLCVGDESLEAAASCDVALIGAIFKHLPYKRVLRAVPRKMPAVHVCWDLYPWAFESPDAPAWEDYAGMLREAADIWVPNTGTAGRVRERVGQDAFVMKPAIHPWERPPVCGPQGCVIDVMRAYPTDPNYRAVTAVCAELGLPCLEPRHQMPQELYRSVVSGARLLVSAYYEASTGGLSLHEGYYHGVPVLCSDSPLHGGRELFGDRAHYFRWDDREDLRCRIEDLYRRGVETEPRILAHRWEWLRQEYGEEAYADRVAKRLKEVFG
jgi:hypothetical protein